MTLIVNHLTGGYHKVPVIHDLNFQIEPGEIVGLIGLNGAGKSTTIKHIIGLLKPQEGQIVLNGHTLAEDSKSYRADFSYIPEQPVIYEELTLREHIQLVAMANDLSRTQAQEQAQSLLDTFRLEDRLDWLPVHFSKGMKQKVMIICAMMLDSSLYVVDEPFVGLDPLGIHDFIDLLLEKKAAGASVLLSTHILAGAEKYCDRFIFLHEGRIRAMGTLDQIGRDLGQEGASLDEIYINLARG